MSRRPFKDDDEATSTLLPRACDSPDLPAVRISMRRLQLSRPYPERHAIKTLVELRLDRVEETEDDPHFVEWLEGQCLGLYQAFGKTPHDELIAEIDKLLDRNRRGRFQSNYAAHQANLLLELRELAAANLTWEDAAPYLAWRTETEDSRGYFSREPAKFWNETPQEHAERVRAWNEKVSSGAQEIGQGLDASVPAMRPHWLVQLAAHHFRVSQFDRAIERFQEVLDKHPGHPRAEVAQLMLARAHLEWSRQLDPKTDGVKIEEQRVMAEAALTTYREGYPSGRFLPDVDGWLGAVYWDREEYGTALTHYLRQTTIADHPEVAWASLTECDRCIRALTDRTPERLKETLPYPEIAGQPEVAMRLAYHLLDKDSRTDFTEYPFRDNGDGQRPIWVGTRIAPARKDARVVLKRLATEIGERAGELSSDWDERYLALYAWIATEGGDHRGAINVTEVVSRQQLLGSDDLLRVRGIAQQRAGLFAEAIESFRTLRDEFPNSGLLDDIDFRLVTCLRESGQIAEAVVVLCNHERFGRNEVWAVEGHSLHFWEEFGQWLDTMLQFGPIEQLKEAMTDARISATSAEMIRNILRSRLLARGEFDSAKQFLSKLPPTDEHYEEETWPYIEGDLRWMDQRRWDEIVAEIVQLNADARTETDTELRAQLRMVEAENWEKYRGYIIMPTQTYLDGIYRSDYRQSEVSRQANGVAAGFERELVDDELERRDELWQRTDGL